MSGFKPEAPLQIPAQAILQSMQIADIRLVASRIDLTIPPGAGRSKSAIWLDI